MKLTLLQCAIRVVLGKNVEFEHPISLLRDITGVRMENLHRDMFGMVLMQWRSRRRERRRQE